jgi:nucleotide-binding universal stress UspA family protein
MADESTSAARNLRSTTDRSGSVAPGASLRGDVTARLASGAQLQGATFGSRRILVCLDRSSGSEVCVPHAVFLARTLGSALILVHVLQPRHEHAGPQTNDALGWEISRREAQGYLERFQKSVSQATGLAVDVRLEQGRPADRIVDLARELGADLCVLGSRGEGGVPDSSGTLGGTVQQVLALSRTSVFIVHSSLQAPAVVAPRRILVPLDGSPRTESVLPAAARIAAAHGAELLLLHVVQEPLQSALLRVADDMQLAQKLASRLESSAERYLQDLKRLLAHDVPSVRTLVLRSPNEYQCLLETSHKQQSDLIVLSAHGSGCDSTQSFGSVTAYLLTHSRIPLLVLQDLPGTELRQDLQNDTKLAPPSLRASYAPESV